MHILWIREDECGRERISRQCLGCHVVQHFTLSKDRVRADVVCNACGTRHIAVCNGRQSARLTVEGDAARGHASINGRTRPCMIDNRSHGGIGIRFSHHVDAYVGVGDILYVKTRRRHNECFIVTFVDKKYVGARYRIAGQYSPQQRTILAGTLRGG